MAIKLFFYFFILAFLFLPGLVLAQSTAAPTCNSLSGVCNPAGSERNWTVESVAAKLIKVILGLVGVISLVLFIWAGFGWMTAGGKTEQIKKARETMVWAVLGLVVIFSAYMIVNFMFTNLLF